MIENTRERIAGSFRDPSGFLFMTDGCLYRQIHVSYQRHYDHLMRSGLYQALVAEGLLIPHEEDSRLARDSACVYAIIRPAVVPFISYPYEWCFSQLKQAALSMLAIQKRALDFGMTLKDASAYNIQFKRGRPVLIDTLSFEIYNDGAPWQGYRQFCQHFLAPLALMCFVDIRLHQLLRTNLDGIPLGLASRLLPAKTRLFFSLATHIHMHAAMQQRYQNRPGQTRSYRMGRKSFVALIGSLETAIKGLAWEPRESAWKDYYGHTNYSEKAIESKKKIVSEFLARIQPNSVFDFGANTGIFSRIAAKNNVSVVAFDSDPAACELHYRRCHSDGQSNILPLVVDLTNPSPAQGWLHQERLSLRERSQADAALALALIHHLAIANNLPLDSIACFFSRTCRWLVIEFVPKTDAQTQRLLAARQDIFERYTQSSFEDACARYFTIVDKVPIDDCPRTLYLLKKREDER
jgi:hypothetical protein